MSLDTLNGDTTTEHLAIFKEESLPMILRKVHLPLKDCPFKEGRIVSKLQSYSTNALSSGGKLKRRQQQ